jgi:hypothetical protein
VFNDETTPNATTVAAPLNISESVPLATDSISIETSAVESEEVTVSANVEVSVEAAPPTTAEAGEGSSKESESISSPLLDSEKSEEPRVIADSEPETGSEIPVNEGSTLIETATATPLDISESVPTAADSISIETPTQEFTTNEATADVDISIPTADSELVFNDETTPNATTVTAPLNISESMPTVADSIAFEQSPTQSETSESIAGAGISGIEDSLGATEAVSSDLPESFTNTADSADVEVRPVKADQVVDAATAWQMARPEAATVEEEEEICEDFSTSVTTAAGSTATASRPLTSDETVNIDETAAADARAPAASLGATSEVSQSPEEAEPTLQPLNVGQSSRPVREETEEEEPMLMTPTDAPLVGDIAGVDTT